MKTRVCAMSVNVIPTPEGATSTSRGRATFGRQQTPQQRGGSGLASESYGLTCDWWKSVTCLG